MKYSTNERILDCEAIERHCRVFKEIEDYEDDSFGILFKTSSNKTYGLFLTTPFFDELQHRNVDFDQIGFKGFEVATALVFDNVLKHLKKHEVIDEHTILKRFVPWAIATVIKYHSAANSTAVIC